MIDETPITLVLFPKDVVRARIVELTPVLAGAGITEAWWNEPSLKSDLSPIPIDRHWDWATQVIEFDGEIIPCVKVAVVTGKADVNLAVQGGMIVSTQPIPSALNRVSQCLIVELLFTAPWNRPSLRRDGRPFLVGVGTQLLKWAVQFSQECGHQGRLRLDASPDFITWYERRGLQKLDTHPIVYEGTAYTPMELTADQAKALLSDLQD